MRNIRSLSTMLSEFFHLFNTADDKGVFTTLDYAWAVHGHHDEHKEGAGHTEQAGKEDHDEDEKMITAMVVKPNSQQTAGASSGSSDPIQWFRQLNRHRHNKLPRLQMGIKFRSKPTSLWELSQPKGFFYTKN
ncbi:hypothetical protein [Effusibacillus consociatus]